MSKYITVQDLKSYGPVQISNDTDTAVLNWAVDWAEGQFEALTGSAFDYATETNERPARSWFDRNGILTIIAKRRAPVLSVSSVYVTIPNVLTKTALAWDPADGIMIPSSDDPPDPDAWRVRVIPTNISLYSIAADDLLTQWTYTGGYNPVPDSLRLTLLRMAFWKLKLREAPLGRINSEMFGTREIIQSLPNDIASDLNRWTRKAIG